MHFGDYLITDPDPDPDPDPESVCSEIGFSDYLIILQAELKARLQNVRLYHPSSTPNNL